MMNRRKAPDFLNGVPELLLLQLLSARPMYGYELVQAIRTSTQEALEFGEGSIYPILHRLEAEQALAGSRQLVNGRNRVVYRITAAGRRRLAESRLAWQRVAHAVAVVLEGGGHASPAVA
jgi:PadR family transcriptional regulator PadR